MVQGEFLFGARTLSVTCGDGEDSLPRSAALSQKAALHLPFPAATPPVKME